MDVTITNNYGFFTFTLCSQAAVDWAVNNVDDMSDEANDEIPATAPFTLYLDDSLYAQDIAQGMLDAGLEVE